MSRHLQLPRRDKRRKTRARRGGLPGTVVPHADAAPSHVRLVRYSSDEFHVDDWTPQSAETRSSRSDGHVTWLDVGGYGNSSVIQQIGDRFGLHPLALEDAISGHQRPKVDAYGDHLFVVARIHLPGTVETEQVSLFLGRDFVVSFQESDADLLEPVRTRIEAGRGRIRQCGADYLLYALLDVIIDGYFPALEEYGERLDALDDKISANGEQNLINEVHGVRTELLAIRRAVWPLRDAINALIRDSNDLISDEAGIYLRDCHDHTVQIIDVIETDRELCADLRDFYLSVVSNRMNQVMKFLTIIATVFMPLSFLAGLYGMNFNTQASVWNMPELNWTLGYPFALGVMATMACGMFYFFWHRGWLN